MDDLPCVAVDTDARAGPRASLTLPSVLGSGLGKVVPSSALEGK
jgi:hypothetical protein